MSFDCLAPHYRWMEFVLAGNKLQCCRLAWLNQVRHCRNVLLMGEGPGRFLEVFPRALPQARVTCVDASRAMLNRAQETWRRVGGSPGDASFVHAALPEWKPPAAAFDLIVTHFFLDCFPAAQLAPVVAQLATAAKPGARWLVSDFQLPRTGPSRIRARAVLALAYAFFGMVTRLPARTLASPDSFLEAQGFKLVHRRTSDWQLLHADLWTNDPGVEVLPIGIASRTPSPVRTDVDAPVSAGVRAERCSLDAARPGS